MATYPNDAIATLTAFPVTSTITYSSTGDSITEFNLAAAVAHRGEVSAFIDGVSQATDTYAISNSGATISFTTPPNASNLTLQTISIPAKLVQTRSTYATYVQEYSNTSPAVVNGNTYLINAHQEAFALPAGLEASAASEIQVFLSGVLQNSDAYVFPSATLGYGGVDIGDNTATKLLLNFTSNLTDDSVSAHTVSHNDTATYATLGEDTYISFDGVDDFLTVPSSDDFNLQDRSFTLDTWVKPDTGTTMTSNQTLISRYEDGDNYYALRLVGSNSNVGIVINTGGEITELYGGNANGGSNYHVAVSYDANFANLRLYVNNVNVSYSELYANQATGGDVSIASNNTVGEELLTGDISFVRLSHATRYRSATHVPLSTSNSLTQISGAPLGSVDQEDSLSIRIFDSSVETLDRFTSMVDRKPDNGIESSRTFDVTTFASQAGYEKRRLKSRRSKRNYQLSYTAVTGIEKTAIENFYNARSGQFESFSFDLSHINESGTINTRFEGPLSIEQTYSNGSRLIDNFYTVSFTLQEVFD